MSTRTLKLVHRSPTSYEVDSDEVQLLIGANRGGSSAVEHQRTVTVRGRPKVRDLPAPKINVQR